jgi:hypothetical protein
MKFVPDGWFQTKGLGTPKEPVGSGKDPSARDWLHEPLFSAAKGNKWINLCSLWVTASSG